MTPDDIRAKMREFSESSSLAAMAAQMNDEQLAATSDAIVGLAAGWASVAAEARPEEFAAAVHKMTDERLLAKSPDAKDVSCRRGCNACCHLFVSIDTSEAALLAATVREEGIAIDRSKLVRQSDRTADTWLSQPREDQRCVFNGEEGECRVYDARPRTCRKYHVVSDPVLCNTETNPGLMVSRLVSIEAEIVNAAAFLVNPIHGSLAALLRKELES